MAIRKNWKNLILPGFAALSLVGATISIISATPTRGIAEPRFAPPTAPSAKTASLDAIPLESTSEGFIGAVGVVEPASEEIAVGTEVSGTVKKVWVKPGDKVEAGAPLFLIDDRAARADLASKKQDLAVEQARLGELYAQIGPAEARVATAEAALAEAKADRADREDRVRRAEQLDARKAIAEEELKQVRFAAQAAAARVSAAEARRLEAQATLALLSGKNGGASIALQQAMVEKAKAAFEQAETQVELHTVRAPQAATVLQVKIRAGEFAPAAIVSTPLLVLGVIDPLHVRVEIDETEVPRFAAAARASASLRGQADRRALLQFVRIEPLVVPKRTLTGAASERVDTRVMQVIYALTPGDLPAHPGQQVDVYVEVSPVAASGSTGETAELASPLTARR